MKIKLLCVGLASVQACCYAQAKTVAHVPATRLPSQCQSATDALPAFSVSSDDDGTIRVVVNTNRLLVQGRARNITSTIYPRADGKDHSLIEGAVMSISENGRSLARFSGQSIFVEAPTAEQFEVQYDGDKPIFTRFAALNMLAFSLEFNPQEQNYPLFRITWHSTVNGFRVTSTALYNRRSKTARVFAVSDQNGEQKILLNDLYQNVDDGKLDAAAAQSGAPFADYIPPQNQIPKEPFPPLMIDGYFEALLKQGCTRIRSSGKHSN